MHVHDVVTDWSFALARFLVSIPLFSVSLFEFLLSGTTHFVSAFLCLASIIVHCIACVHVYELLAKPSSSKCIHF